MNAQLRKEAQAKDISILELILEKIRQLEEQEGIRRTLFAACPNSLAAIRSAIRSAKRCNAPIKFAATLNQVDTDGGYTGLTQEELVKTVHQEARNINFNGPVIVAIDHGGPWLKDLHKKEKWSYQETMEAVKHSFEKAIDAGYDMIHVDPTIDINLAPNQTIDIDVVVERTVELIEHAERYRKENDYPRIAYEVGTEEVHGGLADVGVFNHFMEQLKQGLKQKKVDVWPVFVVGKVGTDLHTTLFDPEMARTLTDISWSYGSVIKGHYTDNVKNPEDYPASGMGAANIGPEFTEREYEGLMEMVRLEARYHYQGWVPKLSGMKDVLWNAVIDSGRWKKWLQPGEQEEDFYANAPERQKWFIKTGCRYIWQKPDVLAARGQLFTNLSNIGVDPDAILDAHIENAMDKYFYRFNLINLNDRLLNTQEHQ
jgi:tagatose-1,6-bisphosphate aldolase non-catalytic subunit AgaZ/GatZ